MTHSATKTTLATIPGRAHLYSANSYTTGELLFMPANSPATTGEALPGEPIRGGVPIIAPWFGDLTGNTPKHGWARRVEWEEQITAQSIDFRTSHDNWDIRLSAAGTADGFAMYMKVRNSSDFRRKLQLAFHPYFLVDDLTGVRVEGLPARAGDSSPITFDGSEYDVRHRIDPDTPTTVSIVSSQRTITVTGTNSDHIVVWNPGRDHGLADLGAEEWENFVCVEPALLGGDETGYDTLPWEWVTFGMTVHYHLN